MSDDVLGLSGESDRYKVTEREAGTGRINHHELAGEAPAPQAAEHVAKEPSGAEGLMRVGGASEDKPRSGEDELPSMQKTAAALAHGHEESLRGLCGNDQVMPEVEAVRRHPVYADHMARIARAEAGREFCLHQTAHLMDTARIAYIRALERRMPFRKEAIYAAALLHDIGKAEQYETGEPHEVAGARVAAEILSDLGGFSALEKTAVVAAVAQHRRYSEDSSPLAKLLFEADKASRPCFECGVRERCHWPEGRQNAGVKV